MAASADYSLQRARKSLKFFMLGKLLSAVMGFSALLLSVRVLPSRELGLLLAVLALVELFYLISGFGLSTVAQRYVAQYRTAFLPGQFARFMWQILLQRTGYSVSLVVLLAALSPWLLPVMGMTWSLSQGILVGILLVLGAQLRFIDEIFGSLLYQGQIQASVFVRNAVKLLAFAMLYFVLQQDISFGQALWLELIATALALLWYVTVLLREFYLPAVKIQDGNGLRQEAERTTSWQFFVVQCLGQVYGNNMQVLLTTRLLGLTSAAFMGFAQALAETIRNYLPAQLLLNWVRPLMVTQFVAKRDYSVLVANANLILKINLLFIVPGTLVTLLYGAVLDPILGGGRFPGLHLMLALFLVLLGLQTMHLVLSLVTLIIERGRNNLWATLLACAGLPLAFVLGPIWGVSGMVMTLCISETIWCGATLFLLRRDGFTFQLDWMGMSKLFIGGMVIGLTGTFMPWKPTTISGSALAVLCSALLFLLVMAILKPLKPGERSTLGRFLPSRLIFL